MTEVLIVVLAMVAFVGGVIAGGAWVYSICMDAIDETATPSERY